MRSDSADTRGACPHKQTLFLLNLLTLLSLSPHLGKAAGVADRKGFRAKVRSSSRKNNGKRGRRENCNSGGPEASIHSGFHAGGRVDLWVVRGARTAAERRLGGPKRR